MGFLDIISKIFGISKKPEEEIIVDGHDDENVQTQPAAAEPVVETQQDPPKDEFDKDAVLRRLGYDGPDAVKQFQRDKGLTSDNVYGPRTEAALKDIAKKLEKAPEGSVFRRWRLTTYWIADVSDGDVPVLDANGNALTHVSARSFSMLSLQGSGLLPDGRLLNVTGKTIAVKPEQYASVLEYHMKYMAKRPWGYSGIFGSDGQVKTVLTFYSVPQSLMGKGYGTCHKTALDPFRTLAADIGAYKSSDPRFKGTGGLVPVGTDVFIVDFVGMKLPDGSEHDGWFRVNDTGGGIYGAHFDVFSGSKKLYYMVTSFPNRGNVWFKGIEDRVDVNYDRGLYDT